MDRMDYGQSVVTIRVLEKRLLTKNRIERMIESETCEEVLKLLSETEYSQDMTDIQNSRDYEKIYCKVNLDRNSDYIYYSDTFRVYY